VDTREFGGKASGKGVPMSKSTGLRYTEEFKGEAVQLARSSPEKSIRQLAYELGISDQTLRNWINQVQVDRGEREGLTTEEREELRRLRRENKILREEREILKAAEAPCPATFPGVKCSLALVDADWLTRTTY
jgi:transposase